MSTSATRAGVPDFAVIPGTQVHDVIRGREKEVIGAVEEAYRLHGAGRTVNPDSYFLTFPDRPSARIIALPASLRGEAHVHGLKWISSFPENVATGLPRASAVLILNDAETGYPFACLESSIISAARTAASAALAATALSERRGSRPRRIGFFGTGLIARYVHTYLAASGFTADETGIHDLSEEHAQGFREYLERSGSGNAVVHELPEDLIRSSDLIVFATVAGQPHVHRPEWFEHNPLVLHISLRDLAPEVVLGAHNITDDTEHCMKARTSLHLTEERVGHRDFVAGTLVGVLDGKVDCPADRPVVFSPFGLGVLDLALALYVYDRVTEDGTLGTVPGFFSELRRYG
ncbi:2,3-diaminopropionate biosynthesis protein SbnB [Streptomyces sp. NPDC047079]|uniref:2,3-diaminopropionate biosynthesis protein SbnB n=1 Tax=Streptomyces sp. NPDC047079 TaxID=3154607 RepID=UPI0033DC24F1